MRKIIKALCSIYGEIKTENEYLSTTLRDEKYIFVNLATLYMTTQKPQVANGESAKTKTCVVTGKTFD